MYSNAEVFFVEDRNKVVPFTCQPLPCTLVPVHYGYNLYHLTPGILAWAVVVGLSVGYLSGLFGVGGGFLLTPLVNVFLGVPMNIAVGSDLSQIVGTSSAAMLRHACQRALWLMGEYPVDKLSQEMPYLLSEHKTIWHARNRPGGFEDSHARLQRMALDCDTISGV